MLLRHMESLRKYNILCRINSGIKRSLYFGPQWYGIILIEVILCPNASHRLLIMCSSIGRGCPTDWQPQFSSSSKNLCVMTRCSRERTGIRDQRDPGYHATNRRYISRVVLFFCRLIFCRSENRKQDYPYSTYLRQDTIQDTKRAGYTRYTGKTGRNKGRLRVTGNNILGSRYRGGLRFKRTRFKSPLRSRGPFGQEEEKKSECVCVFFFSCNAISGKTMTYHASLPKTAQLRN